MSWRDAVPVRRAYVALSVGSLLLTACIGASTETPVPTPQPTAQALQFDIPYIPDGHRDQVLAVHLPEEALADPNRSFPLVFLAHSWTGYRIDQALVAVVDFVNQMGYAAVTIDYRDGTDSGGPYTAVRDGACALAWVYANADTYGFDIHRMVAFGNSFGATMVSILALSDEIELFTDDCPYPAPEGQPFLGVVAFGGASFGVPGPGLAFGTDRFAAVWENTLYYGNAQDIYEVTQALAQLDPLEWSNGDLEGEQLRLAQIQPVYWVDAGDPAFLVLHGEGDSWWPPEESEAFAAVLESVGVPATYVLLPGAGHTTWSDDEATWQEPLDEFLRDVIGEE